MARAALAGGDSTVVPWWRRTDWWRLIGLALALKLILLCIGVVAHGGSDGTWPAIVSQWNHWDAPRFQIIAAHGYQAGGDNGTSIVLFPLFPYAIRFVSLLGVSVPVAAMAVNIVASVAATVVLYELAATYGERPMAFRVAVFWNLFPFAYDLTAGYSEGLFCAALFGSVLQARRRQWVTAGFLAALASATRITGLALVPFLAVEIFLARAQVRRVAEAVVGLLLAPLGFVVYLLINWRVVANPLGFMEIQRTHFFERLAPPWSALVDSWNRMSGGTNVWDRLTQGFANTAAGIAFYATALGALLWLGVADAVFAAGLAVMSTVNGFWVSEPRYLIPMYPLFLLLGRIRNPAVQAAAGIVSFAGLAVMTIAFTAGWWAF